MISEGETNRRKQRETKMRKERWRKSRPKQKKKKKSEQKKSKTQIHSNDFENQSEKLLWLNPNTHWECRVESKQNVQHAIKVCNIYFHLSIRPNKYIGRRSNISIHLIALFQCRHKWCGFFSIITSNFYFFTITLEWMNLFVCCNFW